MSTDALRTAGIPLLVAAAVVGGPAAAARATTQQPSVGHDALAADSAGASRVRTAVFPATVDPETLRTARELQARPVVHVVRAGDTVWALAHRYGVPVRVVLRANNLDSTALIRPGRKLILPGARTIRTPARPAGSVRRRQARPVGAPTGQATGRPASTSVAPAAPAAPAASPAVAPPPRSYPRSVVASAAMNRAALSDREVPSRSDVRLLVAATARNYRLDPAVALAVATMESGFDQRQVSNANAIGTMQVLPSTGAWVSQLVGRRLDLLDAADNVTAGVVLLTVLQAQAPDETTAIAGYYQGLGSINRHGMYPDTRRYVASVQTIAARLR